MSLNSRHARVGVGLPQTWQTLAQGTHRGAHMLISSRPREENIRLPASVTAWLFLLVLLAGSAAAESRFRQLPCPDGYCRPHTPYGYNATQWRRYPGSGLAELKGKSAASDGVDGLVPPPPNEEDKYPEGYKPPEPSKPLAREEKPAAQGTEKSEPEDSSDRQGDPKRFLPNPRSTPRFQPPTGTPAPGERSDPRTEPRAPSPNPFNVPPISPDFGSLNNPSPVEDGGVAQVQDNALPEDFSSSGAANTMTPERENLVVASSQGHPFITPAPRGVVQPRRMPSSNELLDSALQEPGVTSGEAEVAHHNGAEMPDLFAPLNGSSDLPAAPPTAPGISAGSAAEAVAAAMEGETDGNHELSGKEDKSNGDTATPANNLSDMNKRVRKTPGSVSGEIVTKARHVRTGQRTANPLRRKTATSTGQEPISPATWNQGDAPATSSSENYPNRNLKPTQPATKYSAPRTGRANPLR